jgi:metal-dependent hydrolase (beta-lactamase superfamily II)
VVSLFAVDCNLKVMLVVGGFHKMPDTDLYVERTGAQWNWFGVHAIMH